MKEVYAFTKGEYSDYGIAYSDYRIKCLFEDLETAKEFKEQYDREHLEECGYTDSNDIETFKLYKKGELPRKVTEHRAVVKFCGDTLVDPDLKGTYKVFTEKVMEYWNSENYDFATTCVKRPRVVIYGHRETQTMKYVEMMVEGLDKDSVLKTCTDKARAFLAGTWSPFNQKEG